MLLKNSAVVFLRCLDTASITDSKVGWRRFRTAWRLGRLRDRKRSFGASLAFPPDSRKPTATLSSAAAT
jgi:hypothetical protein